MSARIKVADLAGHQLDYWAARADGIKAKDIIWSESDECFKVQAGPQHFSQIPRYSASWAVGGRIVDQLRLNFATLGTGCKDPKTGREPVVAIPYAGGKAMEGPTHLIAAARVYVAMTFGETVKVPAC